MKKLEERLLAKSAEAFLVAIELYNKPTIRYRVEGFSLFICNAWELMLKSHMIKKFGEKSVYYKDNPERTITLENCIASIFTNKKAPLRLNLEKIIELRNTSTHFITEEYEMVYIPLFQSCVFNFTEKMQEFHGIDMTEIIPQNFLTLTVGMKAFKESEIKAKYPEEIATKLIDTNNNLKPLIENNNSAFAIRIIHEHYITKDKAKATSIVGIDNNSTAKVKIVKELKDPNDTHKYTARKCIELINRRVKTLGINFPHVFNRYHFNLFVKYYGIKANPKFCYTHKINNPPTYSYSMAAIDFIIAELQKDPEDIIENIKKS